MDLSDAFVAGQGYVALSRVRSLDGLILKWLNRRALEIDSRVREYDELLSQASDRASERLADLSLKDRKEKTDAAIIRLGGVTEKLDLSLKSKKSPKLATHEETYTFIQQGMDIESIANVRDLKFSTIIAHIEKLIEEWKTLNLENLRPLDEDRLTTVLAIFRKLDTTSLSPVKEYLEEEYDEIYDYDEIRLARLFL